MTPRSVIIAAAIGLVLVIWLTMRARRRDASVDGGPNAGAGNVFDQVDHLMAFGQYDEAVQKLLDELAGDPNSEAHIMKLMEVLFVAGKAEAFLDNARFYRKALGENDWQKVALMGREICPDEALFDEGDA